MVGERLQTVERLYISALMSGVKGRGAYVIFLAQTYCSRTTDGDSVGRTLEKLLKFF
jgi:hypothetical protein